MKLYYVPAACSLAPHIVLNELGIQATLVRVDPRTHRTEHGEDYLRVNPLGYVPALVLDDGSVLREGAAILLYLADLAPVGRLAPAHGTLEHYRLQEWLNLLATEIHKGFIPLLYPVAAGKYVDTARPKLEQRLAWIDQQLADHDYLMGQSFSVADAYLFALVGWGQAGWLVSYYQADIHLDALANLQRWYQRIRTRPSVRAALEREGLQPAAAG